MLDLFNLPTNSGKADIQVFTSHVKNGDASLQTYKKPRGKSMLYIYAVGSGGGGGGGFTGVAGSARGGGGGGGSGAQSTLLVPMHLIPNELYLMVHNGGAGGAVGSAGGAGVPSYVWIPMGSGANIPTNTLINGGISGGGGGGGAAGSASAGGTGGTAASVATIATMPLAGLGLYNVLAGQAGTNGGAHTGAAGTNISLPVTGLTVMGGTGGAGTTSADFAGGAITAVSDSLISESRPINAAAGSNNGSGGYTAPSIFWDFCGLGGGSSNTGVGGDGGNGSYGCGGGGGGGGTTGGRGGNGGSGLVVMIAW